MVRSRINPVVTVLLYALITAFPLFALAQTEDQPASSTEPTPIVTPYETETLLGNNVVGDFVLGPGKIELEIEPGQSKTVKLTVSNRIGEPHTFNVDVEDIGGSDDVGRAVVLLGDDTGPYSLKDYIKIPNQEFELDHNLRATIPVTVSIPPDAEPGGYYGSVLVKTVTQEASDGSDQATAPSSAIVSRIGTLFFVTIPGETSVGGELKDFSTAQGKTWYQTGPINFGITYENTGSLHLNPYGEIRIENMLGEEVGFVELEPWFVLPEATRLREITWDRGLLYGRYTATLKLNRGYDDVIDEASITFWVVPWQYVAGALAVVFIVLFLIRGFFRTFEFKRRGD